MLNTSVNENFINVFPRFYTPKVLDAHHVVAYHSTTACNIYWYKVFYHNLNDFVYMCWSTAIVCTNKDNLLIAQTFFSALARKFLVNVSGIRHSSTSVLSQTKTQIDHTNNRPLWDLFIFWRCSWIVLNFRILCFPNVGASWKKTASLEWLL